MDKHERLFNYWLTELRQRESSNTSVIAITAAASLVVLVFFMEFLVKGVYIENFLRFRFDGVST